MEFAQLCALLAGGLTIGLGAIGSAIGEGITAMKAVEGISRQPSASGKILRTMLIGQAVTETAAIFALVIAFILIFKGPDPNIAKGYAYLAAGIAMGFGAIGSGLGAGLPGGAACEGTAKQPGNSDVLMLHMLIGQAVSQTAAIFALTIALVMIMGTPETNIVTIFSLLGAGVTMGFGAIGPGIGVGYVAKKANEAVARDPKHMGLLTRTMLIGQAVTETTSIYAVVVALILIFVV